MMVSAANDAMPEAASAKSAAAEDKKIIRNVSLTIKTSAYDDSMASLTALLSQYGGYLESSSEYTNNRDLRTASLTREQALAYQAGEALDLGELPEGYTLMCCEGVSLGWGKQAGGLMKNHYPKGLRRR